MQAQNSNKLSGARIIIETLIEQSATDVFGYILLTNNLYIVNTSYMEKIEKLYLKTLYS